MRFIFSAFKEGGIFFLFYLHSLHFNFIFEQFAKHSWGHWYPEEYTKPPTFFVLFFLQIQLLILLWRCSVNKVLNKRKKKKMRSAFCKDVGFSNVYLITGERIYLLEYSESKFPSGNYALGLLWNCYHLRLSEVM